MNLISMDKKYKEQETGERVRVLCIDSGDDIYPVIILTPMGGIRFLTADGREFRQDKVPSITEVSEWDDFKVDEPVMVRNFEDDLWCPRHFKRVRNDGKVECWQNGGTSWSNTGSTVWVQCRRPTAEELAR